MSGCSFHDFADADNFIGGGIGLTFCLVSGFSLGVGHICRKGLLPDPPSQQKIHNKILIFSDPSPGVGVRVTCETRTVLPSRPQPTTFSLYFTTSKPPFSSQPQFPSKRTPCIQHLSPHKTTLDMEENNTARSSMCRQSVLPIEELSFRKPGKRYKACNGC
jgi:hypothetical protein